MAIGIDNIVDYVMTTPENTNPAVLKSLLNQYTEAVVPDLSEADAAAGDIVVGKKAADKDGEILTGTLFTLGEGESYGLASYVQVISTVPGQNGKIVFVSGLDAELGTITSTKATVVVHPQQCNVSGTVYNGVELVSVMGATTYGSACTLTPELQGTYTLPVGENVTGVTVTALDGTVGSVITTTDKIYILDCCAANIEITFDPTTT